MQNTITRTKQNIEKKIGDKHLYPQFWDIWLINYEYLYKQCLDLLSGNKTDAEDILSEIMLQITQKDMQRLTQVSNKRAWLKRLVYNACMDLYRTQKSHDNNADELLLRLYSYAKQLTPQTIINQQQQVNELKIAMNGLSLQQRNTLELRCIGDFSYTEIAKHQNISPNLARKRIQQARNKLREIIHSF